MFGMTSPLNVQTSLPSSVCTTRGAAPAYLADNRLSNMSGGSTTWSSTLMKIMSSTRMSRAYDPGRVRRSGATAPASLTPVATPAVDQLARVVDATGELVAGVRDDQWS